MATLKPVYAASAALTITIASLPTSATLVAGEESTAVSNTTNKYVDALIGGKITTGTSPTIGSIEVWGYAAYKDTPTYPDVLDGTDSAETIASVEVKNSMLKLLWSTATNATSNITYYMPPVSLAERFGHMPTHWGIFVVHNTVAVLHATGSNHEFYYTGIHYESV